MLRTVERTATANEATVGAWARIEVPPLVLTSSQAAADTRQRLGSLAEVVDASGGRPDSVDLPTALDLLAERGLPVRDRVLSRTVLSPADLERRTGAPGGAIYGTSSNGAAAAFLRPANRSPVPGLYLVGGSSHPGGGLPLVALGGRSVAREIARG